MSKMEYKETKPIAKKGKKFFGFFTIFIFVFLVVLFSFLFSPLLSVNYFDFLSTTKANSKTFHFVLTTAGQSEADAQSLAQDIYIRGGAGVVIQEDEIFYCILSAYKTKSDAENVVSSLDQDEYRLSIKEVNTSLNISKSLTKEEKTLVNKSFDFLLNTVDNLHDLSTSLDSGNILKADANLTAKSIFLELSYLENEFQSLQSTKIKPMHLAVISALSLVEYLASEDAMNTALLPYSAVVRRTFTRIIMLCEDINI